jgi:hypothetical protein
MPLKNSELFKHNNSQNNTSKLVYCMMERQSEGMNVLVHDLNCMHSFQQSNMGHYSCCTVHIKFNVTHNGNSP